MYKKILIFISLAFVIGCQKNELKIASTDSFTCPNKVVTERDGTPVVQVLDNTLVFQSIEHYNQVREWVQSTSVSSLMAWQQSLGFKSSRYYYEEAFAQNCCPDEEGNIEQVATLYSGKVIYDSIEKDIKPLLPFLTTGWLVNYKGDFRVGQSLVRYTSNYVISVIDGSSSKLANALLNPVDDVANGIYVHPTEVANRRGCCALNLNAPSVSNGSKRIKTASISNLDESFSVFVPNFGTLYNVIFTFKGYFHHQRKTWFGWTVCQRTKWDYRVGEVARLLNIPANCQCTSVGFVNPKTINIAGISGNECKYDFEQQVFSSLNVTPDVYWKIDLCVEEIWLNTKALDSNLFTSNQCK